MVKLYIRKVGKPFDWWLFSIIYTVGEGQVS